MVWRMIPAALSTGKPKMPVEMAGKAMLLRPFWSASLRLALTALASLASSSPSPQRGPTAWMTVALLLDGRPALGPDRSGHPAAQDELGVGRVDDGLDFEFGQVSLDDLQDVVAYSLFHQKTPCP